MTKTRYTNWPLFALATIAAIAAEALIAFLLWEYEPDHLVGVTYSVLTASFSLLGLVASRAAGLMKADARGEVSRRAFRARCVSVALLLPTVFVGGGVLALRMEDRAAIEYAGSAQYAADLANSKSVTLDSAVVAQATADLGRAIRPTQARMDDPAYVGSVMAFLAMMLLPSLAVGFGIVAAPETPAQERRRLEAVERETERKRRSAIAVKAAKTRAANAKRKGFKPTRFAAPNVARLVR